MWFKVRINNDGSVNSCEEVEIARQNGQTVIYVDAADKVSAIRVALLEWHQIYSKQRRVAAQAVDLCHRCCIRPRLAFVKACAECHADDQRNNKIRKLRKELSEAPAGERKDIQRKIDGLRKTKPVVARGRSELAILTMVLRQCDEMTATAFRFWLVERIQHLSRKTRRRNAWKDGLRGAA